MSWLHKAATKSTKNVDTGCIEFNGAKDSTGYGRIRVGYKVHAVHRLSFKHFKGEIPDDVLVRHTCDNPACWNPEHLLLGSQLQNMQDMRDRSRNLNCQNESHWHCKLSDKDVAEIRELAENKTFTHKRIAQMYGVSRSHVSSLTRGVYRRQQSVPNK